LIGTVASDRSATFQLVYFLAIIAGGSVCLGLVRTRTSPVPLLPERERER